MDDNLIHKLINKVKDKFSKNNQTYPSVSEYAFSTEEIESINKQNKQKISKLKQDTLNIKKKDNQEDYQEALLQIEPTLESDTLNKETPSPTKEQEKPQENLKENLSQEIPKPTLNSKPQQPSFINLSKEHQQLVMDKWNEIKLNQIDKDIIEGKDLLNHNYTITYADEAAKFIHYIRKEYEIVICYLIGFNNEKQGIMNKTIFSTKIDDEWKYLNNYIKILEKIRNFKK